MKAIGYIRVSTQHQELSPEAQKELINAKGLELGASEVIIFEDRISGGKEIDKRGGLVHALSQLGEGDYFVITKLDRLARDLRNQLAIEYQVTKAGATLVSCAGEGTDSEGPHAKFTRQILGAVAELERELAKERAASVRAWKRSQGHVIGRVPFGFRAEQTNIGKKSTKRLIEDTKEQGVIKDIMQMREAGMSQRKIVVVLNEKGITTKRGKKWSLRQVQRILDRKENQYFTINSLR